MMGNIERLFCKPPIDKSEKAKQCVRAYANGVKPECITIDGMKIVPCEHLNAKIKEVA